MTATEAQRSGRALLSGEDVVRAAGDGPIMMFDGVCNLCCASVEFYIRRDRAGAIRYLPMQSELGQRTLALLDMPRRDFETFVVLDGTSVFVKSDAVFHLLRYLPPPWPMLRYWRLIPRPVRDATYDLVARNRYRLIGRRASCHVPRSTDRARFIRPSETKGVGP